MLEKTPENVRRVIEDRFKVEEFIPTMPVDELVTAYLEGRALPYSSDQEEEIMGYVSGHLSMAFDRYKPNLKAEWMASAEKIPVKVGDREFQTYIDSRGVQRFVGNPMVAYLAHHPTSKDAYNDLFVAYYRGEFSDDELLDFVTSLGYSVSGFAEINALEHYPIQNPLWE